MARDLKPDLQWRFFSENGENPIIGSSSAKTTLLASQHSERQRQRSARVLREPGSVLLPGLCVCPRQSPGHGGQQGDPRGDVARSAVPCCGLSPLDVSVCCATATAVTPGKQWGQSWSWSGAGGCWVVPAALLVLMHTVTSCRTGSTRQRRLKYFL